MLDESQNVAREGEGSSEKLARLTEENVPMQLVRVQTDPSVAGATARGELIMSGRVFEIGSGVVRTAEAGRREFVPVTAANGIAK